MAFPQKTTTNYKCYFNNYTISENDGSQPNTITEEWTIELKESTYYWIKFEGIDYRQMIAEGAIPNIGATYGGWNTNATPANYSKWQAEAICIAHDFGTISGGRVVVRHTFSTRLRNNPAQNTATTVTLHLPTSAEYQSGFRQTEYFTKPPWTIQPAYSGSGSTGHIGGTVANPGSKEGLVQDIPQLIIQVRTIKDAREAPKHNAVTHFTSKLNNYNEPAFFGYTAGTLQYQGFNIIDLESSMYEIIHTLVYDGLYFNDQIATIDTDGLPVTNETGTELADVRWSRTVYPSFDFKEIFFTGAGPVGYGTGFDAVGYTFAYKGYY